MKRASCYYILVCLLIAVFVAGCGKYKVSSELALGDVELGMTASELKSLDLDLMKTKEEVDDGDAKFYHPRKGITVRLEKGKVVWASVGKINNKVEESELANFKTPKGVSLNSPPSDIKDKYGEPGQQYRDGKKSVVYRYRLEEKNGKYGTLVFKINTDTNTITGIEIWDDDLLKDKFVSPKDDNSNKTDAKPEDTTTKNDNVSASMNNDKLGLGGISLNNTEKEIQNILGKPIDTETKEGGVTVLKYKDVQVCVKNHEIQMLVSNSENAKTSKGIHEQSPIHDAVKEYGGSYTQSEYGDLNLLEYQWKDNNQRPCIMRFAVNKSDDKINYISIRRKE